MPQIFRSNKLNLMACDDIFLYKIELNSKKNCITSGKSKSSFRKILF